ncbi:NAD(+)/NADH kinase [Anaerococcus sp. AGMB00486]|uniref:NAD kinase n=2 Tax=Anaerococcus TaxID=165779 RepID=A0ABX2N7K5_9FIRM|nr:MULTISPECIES: NAD(+)/NADH kinase [Anaerococcus]MDY3007219.1 NAD(+)/NADH kinase [Anaerococcus porci]MSS76843.1 NAD(+)/NADH kinase [Anaerococcus porci]NVF10673.1 NAD(+)/NADH kinase [Anaerococcus faecalis]
MTKIINIFKNKSRYSKSIYNKTKEILKDYGYEVSNSYNSDACLNLVIGGDGTFLNAVKNSKFSTIPFIGINTGHLGFYQEVAAENIEDFVKSFHENNYKIENLPILESRVGKSVYYSVNEVVVKSNKNQLIRLRLFIDGNFIENFSGDGLIISTPHGSTAYNLSANGAILHQSLDGFQLTPIAPVFSSLNRSLKAPIVLPKNAEVEINVSKRDSHHTVFIFDGKEFKSKSFKIRTKIADKQLKKLILNKNHYWTNIKNKLL